MALEEEHDFPNHLLLGPAGGDALPPQRADALDLLQSLGRLLDDLKHRLTEGGDQSLGVLGADSLDHAAGEVTLDTGETGWRCHLEKRRAKLQTVVAMVIPPASGVDGLAGLDQRGLADQCHRVAPAPGLDPEHAKAILGVMEGHPFDQPGQGLAVFLFVVRHRGWPDQGISSSDSTASLPGAIRPNGSGRRGWDRGWRTW